MTQINSSQPRSEDLVDAISRLRSDCDWLDRLEAFTRAVYRSLHPTETAYTIANDGRRLIGCDRLAVVLRDGAKCRIEAISGQESLNRRANSLRLLSALCRLVLATGESFWHPNPSSQLAPQIESCLEEYLDQTQVKSLVIVPLVARAGTVAEPEAVHVSEEPLGGLVIEQFSELVDQAVRQRAEAVGRHSAAALHNALEHHGILLLPLSTALRKLLSMFGGPSAAKRVAVSLCVVVLLLCLWFLPARFTLTCSGTVEPERRHHVFAGMDGVVRRLHVQEGSVVTEGQVLVELRNSDLDFKLEEVLGQLQTTNEELAATRTSRHDRLERAGRDAAYFNELAGKEKELREWAKSLERQHAILAGQKAELMVRSPIQGEVITWNVREMLAVRPVRRGDRLMTVADLDGPWVLELRLADPRAGHLVSAQDRLRPDLAVSFILATDPGRELQGRITKVARSVTVDQEHGQSLLVTVGFNKHEADFLRPGAGVTAKIDCGRRPFGYVWLHELFEFIQSRILFRI